MPLPRLLALVLLATLSPARAQDVAPSNAFTLKVDSKLVAVSAIVRDKSGQPVANLTRDDFLLEQDGVPQPIAYFSQGADLPLTLVLMVDTSGSQINFMQDEIAASRAFFPAMLTRPDDRAMLVRFASQIWMLGTLTGSVSTLDLAIDGLAPANSNIAYHGPPITRIPRPGGPGPLPRAGTVLFDTICTVSQLDLGNQLGRSAIVLLTDGGDNGSYFRLQDAIRDAQSADIMIYSIYYAHRGGGNERVLKELSLQTGGREFIVDRKRTLQKIYASIAADLRLQYELGYRPPDAQPGTYHKIDLHARNKKLTIQARNGYFTPK
jgi:Ca-activated chloride channel family protein